MRRNNDQVPALLLGLPQSFAGLNSIFLCMVVLGEDDAVSVLNITANSHRLILQFHIQHTLDRSIEVVHIAVENCSSHYFSPLFDKFVKYY